LIVRDTNVLSEPLEQQPDEHVLAWLASLEEEAGVTSISVGELLTGVRALPAGRRREGPLEAIETTLRTFAGSVLISDEGAARHGCWSRGVLSAVDTRSRTA
jgi:toxin FitB